MKFLSNSLSTTKSLAGLLLLLGFSASLHAASIISLTGTASDVKYASDAEIRLSLIDWSTPAQLQAVESAYRDYQENDNLDDFLKSVEAQDTRGYLFSAAATGYRIKYAWKAGDGKNQFMYFLTTPGLKTRNPYLWKTSNDTSPAFTLVQVHLQDDKGVAKSSLAGKIAFNDQGHLALEDFDKLPVFSSLEDSTPYYLK